MARRFLGIDAGQSATVAMIGDEHGAVLGVGHGGPVGHHEESDAHERARASVLTATLAALGDESATTLSACCISTTGSPSAAASALAEVVGVDTPVTVIGDAMSALAAGSGAGGGVALVSGTGSVAIAASKSGESVVRGGWGWLMGDLGSGFWIGLEAIRAAALADDGMGQQSTLVQSLPGLLGETELRGVYNQVTGQRLNRPLVASLARQVSAAAAQGDSVAQQIINAATEHLGRLVIATVDAAPFLTDDERVIILTGGVLSPGSPVSVLLEPHLRDALPEFVVRHPDVPAVVGAYYLALRQVGVEPTDQLRQRTAAEARSWDLLSGKHPVHLNSSTFREET